MALFSSTRILPHGPFTLVPSVLTTFAWFAALFQSNCNFATTDNFEIINELTFVNNDGITFVALGKMAFTIPPDAAGAESFDWYGTCLPYPKNVLEFDWTWGFARACSFLSLVLGGGAAFYLWTSTCYTFQKSSWRWAGWEVLGAAFFQALSFVWFANKVCRTSGGCSLYKGAKTDILSTIFWLVAATIVFSYYPEPKASAAERDGVMVNENGGIETARSGDSSFVETNEIEMPRSQDDSVDEQMQDVQIS